MPKAAFRLSFTSTFTEAANAAKERVPLLPSEYYGEIPDAARRAAWTISNVGGLSQINAVLQSLNEAIAKGVSLDDWKKEAAEKNWALSSQRLDLVYRTHVQSAYMSGHWQEFERNKQFRPFLMYSAIDDDRVRPTHLAMSGYIARVEDPIWNEWSPPCGFNCRCTLISLSQDQAKARGYGKQKIPAGVRPDEGFGHHPDAAKKALNEYMNGELEGAPGVVRDALVRNESRRAPPSLAVLVREFIGKQYDAIADSVRKVARELGMSVESATALRQYTEGRSSSLNVALQGGLRTLDDATKAAITAIERGLSRLEEFEGTAYRSLGADAFASATALTRFVRSHAVGDVIEYRGFTTASTSATKGGAVSFVIEVTKGRDISALSAADALDVMFSPGSKFRVTRVEYSRSGRATIFMRQVSRNTPSSDTFATKHENWNNEISFDEHAMAAFKATHDGKTPLDLCIEFDPIYAEIREKPDGA